MKIYKQIRSLFEFDVFVIHSTLLFVTMMMNAMVMGTFLVKQQGILMPLAFISGVALAESLSGMVIVYFKTTYVQAARFFIGVRVLMFCLLILMFTDIISTNMWVYIVVVVGVMKGVIDSTFAINYEDAVSNGVPAAGAGNIEVPGAYDQYAFTGAVGER